MVAFSNFLHSFTSSFEEILVKEVNHFLIDSFIISAHYNETVVRHNHPSQDIYSVMNSGTKECNNNKKISKTESGNDFESFILEPF
jgi:hypothetical protein